MMACAPEPLLDAMKNAITATITTMILPTQRISFSSASLRMIGLYISDVNELDATSSCESAVDTVSYTHLSIKNHIEIFR